MTVSTQFNSIDPTQILTFFEFEVKETPYPYISFSKIGYPTYLIFRSANNHQSSCFNTVTLCTVTSAEIYMQVSTHSHFQSISEQITAIQQVEPFQFTLNRDLSPTQVLSHYLRLFPIRNNQYLSSCGFDLDESQFHTLKRHLFLHDDHTCAVLLYDLESHQPANAIFFNSDIHTIKSKNHEACNSIIDNPEFPNLICAFPHQILLHLHFSGEAGQRFNFHLVNPHVNVKLTQHLAKLNSDHPDFYFLHGHFIPLLVHNLELQLSLIYLNQIVPEGKSPFYLRFSHKPRSLDGTLTIAKPAGAWSRRDTSLFSAMNIEASKEFAAKPESYIQEPLDDYRIFRYERFKEPALHGIRIHFHFKAQLFKIIIQALLDRIGMPFKIHFTHLNTSFE